MENVAEKLPRHSGAVYDKGLACRQKKAALEEAAYPEWNIQVI
jgi:hypothetical protein